MNKNNNENDTSLAQLQPHQLQQNRLSSQKQQESQSKYRKFFGIIGCLGGLFMHLIIGSLYQWGIINIYITSYYRTLEPSLTLQNNAIAFPIMMMCIGPTMRLGLFLSQITHPLIIIIINQILLALLIFISSYMKQMSLFLIFYGVLFGLVSGNNFMIPIVQCNKYFPGKRMYVNGVILIGTGMGSVIFGLFSYNYLNPNKLPPINGYYEGSPQLQAIAQNVPNLLKYLALFYIVIGGVGAAMIAPVLLDNRKKQNKANAKKAQQQNKYKQENKNEQILQVQKQLTGEAGTLCEAFSSFVCWIQALIFILAICGSLLVNGNYKTYVKATINDDQFLTIIGVVGSIANGCTRFFWSLLFSKTGYKTVMLIILFINIAVFATQRFTVTNKILYLIQVFLANACIGGILVVAPTLAQALFGQRTGSNIYGFYWTCFATANFIGYAFVSQLSKKIGFNNVIYICLGMCVLAIPLLVFSKFQGPWKNSTIALEYLINYQEEKINKLAEQQLRQKAIALQMQSNFLIRFKLQEGNPQQKTNQMQSTKQ